MDILSILTAVLCFLLIFMGIAVYNYYSLHKRMRKIVHEMEQLYDSDINELANYRKANANKNAKNVSNSDKNKEENLDLNERESNNRESLINILEKLGSQPKLNEDENLEFSYQGENFLVIFNGAFLRIWDLSWYSIKVTDDNFPIIRDAANYANFSFGPVIVMHSPDEESNVIFSSRWDIPFSSTMHDPEGYLKAILDPFFGIKQSLRRELDHLKDNPKDRTMHDNPIGFDTAALSDPTSPQAN